MNNSFKRWLKFGAYAVLIAGFASCETNTNPEVASGDKTMQELNVPANFDWSMRNAIEFEFTALDNQGKIVPNAYVEIFDIDPYSAETGNYNKDYKAAIFVGQTDAQGKLVTTLAVNKTSESLYICPKFPSLPNRIELAIEGRTQLSLSVGGKLSHEDLPDAPEVTEKKGGSTFMYLSRYNSKGVPRNLENPGDILSADFLASVDASLPESRPVPEYNSEYIQDGTQPNLVLTKDAKVWLTFVHEGAGYKNGVGYYTYPVGQEPNSKYDIAKYHVVFPNVSLPHDGAGDLNPGDKVQLKYWNESKGMYQETFPKNTVVAWFLVADGWNKNDQRLYTNGRIVYSTPDFNVEQDPTKRRHNVLLIDQARELLLLGFEDLHREIDTDEDFNDAIFYTKIVPFDACDGTHLPPTTEPKDPNKEYDNKVAGTLAYEDLWPAKGDYDFNDLVLDYNINQVTNNDNKVVRLVCDYTVRATGASFHNGFAIQLPVSPDKVKSVTGTVLSNDAYLNIAANGTENGQANAVIPFFEDAYNVLTYVGGSFINTSNDGYYSEPVQRTITIEFTQPISISTLGVPPYNPFLIVNRTNEKRFAEVHLPNYSATTLAANSTLFGTIDDRTIPGHTYLSDKNLPWALHIPEQFSYPFERVEITTAYTKFAEWAETSGVSFPDWYQDKPGYRVASAIYSH